jgi:hypothetical protein
MTVTDQLPMSAITPKADMCDATTDVRYGPIADLDVSDQRRNVAVLFRRA